MSAEKDDNYNDDDQYDEGYDDEDFEEFDSQSRKSSPLRTARANTPYLNKQDKVPSSGEACITDDCGGDEGDYEADDNDSARDADGAALDVDLESYMNKYLSTSQHSSEIHEASSSETRPLDGLVPTEQLSASLDQKQQQQQQSRRTMAFSPSSKKSN